MRSALIEQSNAFVELADKCQAIFKAQGAMMELIPESVDIPFLSEDHQCKPYVILNVPHGTKLWRVVTTKYVGSENIC